MSCSCILMGLVTGMLYVLVIFGRNHLYYSGEEKYYKNGVGFLIHKDIKDFVTKFKPISSRICTSRLRAKPLNISIIQISAPTSDYTDEQIEMFYSWLQDVIDKDMLIIQRDWDVKIGTDSLTNCKYCGPSCNNSMIGYQIIGIYMI